MRISFTFGADIREVQGKGASRRLRHTGKVPAILYGAREDPQALILDQQNLLTMIADERFYSSIVRLKIGERTQEAIIKDVQMHPAKNVVVHVDLQRVVENETIRIRLPIHFRGESVSPGVKTQGGVVSHMRADVEVSCLPKDLPEFLELDLSGMSLNDTKFLAEDRKSTRLNSSHSQISYAVFCLKKKKKRVRTLLRTRPHTNAMPIDTLIS